MRRIAMMTLGALALGCAGRARIEGGEATKQTLRSMPGWYRKPPKADETWLFAPATATSRELQVALDRAQSDGRLGLATQLEAKYSALSRRFVEETGLSRDAQLLSEYEQTYKSVVSQVLIGSRAREQQFEIENGVYRAWVLMELPVGAASERLLKQIQQQEQMYARFRSSQAFKELNAEVDKYEQWKSGQKP